MSNVIERIKEYGELAPSLISRAGTARDAFLKGYNCTQSMLIAFSDIPGLSGEILKVAQPLGGGLSRLREVCGAVSGGALVLGAFFGSTDPKDREAKNEVYKTTQLFAKRFEELNGSIVCRELLGLKESRSDSTSEARTKEYYAKRPCADLVWLAALLVAQIAESKNP